MLELKICFRETCDGIVFIDKTGTYDAISNPTGYGVANGATGPQAFTSYLLKVWPVGQDTSTPPFYTQDLVLSIPGPTVPDGFYEWEISAEDMGLTHIQSGIWYAEVQAGYPGGLLEESHAPLFTKHLKKTIVDPIMKDADPTCPCKEDCHNPHDIFAAYHSVACNGPCSEDSTTAIINWLYSQKHCC